jgi:hypothetical protein
VPWSRDLACATIVAATRPNGQRLVGAAEAGNGGAGKSLAPPRPVVANDSQMALLYSDRPVIASPGAKLLLVDLWMHS